MDREPLREIDVTWLRHLVRIQHGLDEIGALNVIDSYERHLRDLQQRLDRLIEAATEAADQSDGSNLRYEIGVAREGGRVAELEREANK